MPERNGDRFAAIDQRVTTLENQVGDPTRPGSIEGDIVEIKTRLTGVETTLEDHTGRLKAHHRSLQAVQQTLSDHTSRLTRVEDKLDALDGKVGALDGKVGALDGKFDALDRKFDVFLHGMTELKNLLRPSGEAPG
jgi:chromosome segregation ATPase